MRKIDNEKDNVAYVPESSASCCFFASQRQRGSKVVDLKLLGKEIERFSLVCQRLLNLSLTPFPTVRIVLPGLLLLVKTQIHTVKVTCQSVETTYFFKLSMCLCSRNGDLRIQMSG